MLGLLVILVVSWALLHFVQKAPITVLGFTPVLKRIYEVCFGFIILSMVNFSFIIDQTWITGATWVQNPELSVGLVLETFKYHFISALTEDLVFRGALLYILIERIGSKKALWLAAIVFGIYHWFSYGLIGSGAIVQMAVVFIMTGFMGYAWAYVFHKTKSMAMGLGMHLGWNMLQSFFYEGNPYGEVLFSLANGNPMGDWLGLAFTLAKAILPPLACIWMVDLYVKNDKVTAE